jgi:hypothetical protein
MTYRGRETFTSALGGFVSIAVVITLLTMFGYRVRDLFQRNQTQIKKNTLISISNSYTPPEDISAKNITIAFMLSNFFGEGAIDEPKYGYFKLIQFTTTLSPTGRVFNTQEIPYSKCEFGRNFFYPDEVEVKDYFIENYYCPDWQNLTL